VHNVGRYKTLRPKTRSDQPDTFSMHNAEQFSLFASQIFEILYDSFPIPIPLPTRTFIAIQQSDEAIFALNLDQRVTADAFFVFDTYGELSAEEREAAEKKISILNDQSREAQNKRSQLQRILDGTLSFLVLEGFIREDDNAYYQLTLKGFNHLNKCFEQTGIQDQATIIERLRDALRPEKFSGSVATGVLTSLVSSTLTG
jgi:hypothetical protein